VSAGDAKKPSSRYQDLASSSLGIEVAVATLLGGFLGWWLDGRLHTKPWLMLGGLVLGAVIGWVDVWVQIRNMDKDETKNKNNGKKGI
jgi:F0F1-type ATP synthase assembly protein I